MSSSRSFFSEEEKPISEINIVPFVDILLVILIIFMVATPFVIKSGLALDLPQASSAKTLKTLKVHIVIQADGTTLLDGKLFNLSELQKKMEKRKEHPKDSQVMISADKNILHGKVISVINAVQLAGFKKVTISTIK